MTSPVSNSLKAAFALYDRVCHSLAKAADDWLLGLGARLVFAAVLFGYFWSSAMTKISDGVFGFVHITAGAYAQILPRTMEAVGYDPSQLSWPLHVVVYAGTYAEIVLPIMLVLGLLTRIAAIKMIGFVLVQSIVDIIGHGAEPNTIGALFDNSPEALILDQRLLWVFVLCVLVAKGAGRFTLDALLLEKRKKLAV
jgi:putative oxidoreductase